MTGLQVHVTDEEKQAWKERFPESIWKTVPEGASTSVYAATSPDLTGKGGAYLEDNDIASEVPPDPVTKKMTGQAPHARDDVLAAKLWELSEKATGASLSL